MSWYTLSYPPVAAAAILSSVSKIEAVLNIVNTLELADASKRGLNVTGLIDPAGVLRSGDRATSPRPVISVNHYGVDPYLTHVHKNLAGRPFVRVLLEADNVSDVFLIPLTV